METDKAKVEELEGQVKLLSSTVASLSKQMADLLTSRTIPVELEFALLDRGFIKFDTVTQYPAGDTDYTSNEGFRVLQTSTTSMNAFPIRWITVPSNVRGGQNLYIPLYTFAEFA